MGLEDRLLQRITHLPAGIGRIEPDGFQDFAFVDRENLQVNVVSQLWWKYLNCIANILD